MEEPLFRPEASGNNTSKTIGTVAVYSPPWRWLVVSVIAVITLTITLFFIFGSYTKRENASGELLPVKGVTTLVPQSAGTITRIAVKEGDRIHRGQPLIEIASELATSQGATWDAVIAQLQLQSARLENEQRETAALNAETLRGLLARQTILHAQIAQMSQLIAKRAEQVRLAQRQLDKLRRMNREGYASGTQVDQQETTLLDAGSAVQELQRQRLEQQQQLAQLAQQIGEQPMNATNQQHELEVRLAGVRQSLAENESRRSVVLRAPQDGTVGTVLGHVGQGVTAGQSLISLLPQDSPLEARMLVSSRAIGFIRPGQKVVLRYQAFPYQKFGQQYGQVVEVSRTALTPQEIAAITGNNKVEEQQYRVRVALNHQQITAYGKSEPLRSGMAVEADFLIEHRRLIEWVLEPLFAQARRAVD